MSLFSRMKLYTVHIQPTRKNPYESPVFIREGFNVYAFLLGPLWALYHRMWLAACALMAVVIGIEMLKDAQILSEPGVAVLQLGIATLAGMFGNDWRRRALSRRGYVLADLASGLSLLESQQRFFERVLVTQ